MLHRQAMRVPTGAARRIKPAHGFVSGIKILKRPGEHMVEPRLAVGRWRAFVKTETFARAILLQTALEYFLRLPELEHFALKFRAVIAFGDGGKRHRRYALCKLAGGKTRCFSS